MPLKFETDDMYRATAESVREQLMENWNATYSHFHATNPKQAYYISCLLYTSPSPRDKRQSRMPSSA